MGKIDAESIQNLQEIVEKHVKKYASTLVDEIITSRLGVVQNSTDMQFKALFSTLNTILQAQKMIEMQINYKVGNIEGRVKKQNKEEFVADDLDLESAVILANKVRERMGLPPLVVPKPATASIDQPQSSDPPEDMNPREQEIAQIKKTLNVS